MKRWIITIALLVSAVWSPAQMTETDKKMIEEIKIKAEQGDASAQCALGVFYFSGESTPKDAFEATKWFLKSAKQGDKRAQLMIAACYSDGEGISKDYNEAAKWYRKAAEQGEPFAQLKLGFCYAAGRGVEKNLVEAVNWIRRSAEQNFGDAQYALGLAYLLGNGVPRDYPEAYMWFNLAAATGNDTAKKQMNGLGMLMTPDQIAEGQRLAREFKAHKQTASGGTASQEGNTGPSASGTGFFITEDGFVITNAHVVKDATKIRLVTGAGSMSARVVRVDSANDLALLKAEGKFMALPVASSRTMRLGNTVATVGFPNIGMQGFAPKLGKGEVAALSGAGDDSRYFQISVPVQPGNSGGALVDEHGNVVGVVSAKLNARAALSASGSLPENVNYAVKSSFLLSFLESAPEVSAKLLEPDTRTRKFEDVVKSTEQSAVLVLVY